MAEFLRVTAKVWHVTPCKVLSPHQSKKVKQECTCSIVEARYSLNMC